MNLTTFDLPSLGVNEIERAVEFHFDKAFQKSARPVLRLGRRDANKGDRIGVEEKVQVMLLRILHIPYAVVFKLTQVEGEQSPG